MGCRKISILEYFIAFAIRLALMVSGLQGAVKDRVELSTPLNSWKKLQEGIHLYDSGVDPYTGDLFHETPLTLLLFRALNQHLNSTLLLGFFITLDLLTAYILFKTAAIHIHTIKQEEKRIMKEDVVKKSKLKLTEISVTETPVLVAYAYLYNPYIVLNCAALTTTVLSNLFHALLLYSLASHRKYLCVTSLALSTLQTFYPALLIVPVCIQFYNTDKSKFTVLKLISSYVIALAGLIIISKLIAGSWQFLDSIYFFTMNVHDLTPNIGLFWYFFTEMFEHFRALFIAALQINATVLYLVPLSLHLKKEPVFLTVILMSLTATFKSYPSLGDVGFYLALLPLWKHLFLFMQQLFIVACMLVITSVLGPTVWHLWIYSGSANANFFFGVTLAFATAQIFLITDLLFAHKKREFALTHGWLEDTNKFSLALE